MPTLLGGPLPPPPRSPRKARLAAAPSKVGSASSGEDRVVPATQHPHGGLTFAHTLQTIAFARAEGQVEDARSGKPQKVFGSSD